MIILCTEVKLHFQLSSCTYHEVSKILASYYMFGITAPQNKINTYIRKKTDSLMIQFSM